MLDEIRDKLYDIILADGSIEDLDNKIRVIDLMPILAMLTLLTMM
jgi:hypothetical protein